MLTNKKELATLLANLLQIGNSRETKYFNSINIKTLKITTK
jgi:hypothetical protein